MASGSVVISPDNQLDLVTLGMFIVDEIHFPPPRKPELNIIGGAGAWAIIGARLFREPPQSRRLGWIIHKGSDFPEQLEYEIKAWDTSCAFISTPDRLTTRGWNKYGEGEVRDFEYSTPKLAIDETHLSEEQVLSRSFHMICRPARCISLVEGIRRRREQIMTNAPSGSAASLPKPIIVWEPVPYGCEPEELDKFYEALSYVDVVSPNHQELAHLLGETRKLGGFVSDMASVRRLGERVKERLGPGSSYIVVRCGEAGVLWSDSNGSWHSLQPYHRVEGARQGLGDPSDVIDPTGAGNAFLGALCTGMVDNSHSNEHTLEHAVRCGLVAASFAIEQVGLPHCSMSHGKELWNNDAVIRRYAALELIQK